jgi:uncharacterized protein (DUF302 family)
MSYYITKKVKKSFEETLAIVTEELKKEGFGVLTEIDVKETLKKKLDVDYKKYKILGACNPLLAHQALNAESEIGVLLPCNVCVYEEEEGSSVVSAIDPKRMFSVVERSDLVPIANEVSEKIHRVIDNIR